MNIGAELRCVFTGLCGRHCVPLEAQASPDLPQRIEKILNNVPFRGLQKRTMAPRSLFRQKCRMLHGICANRFDERRRAEAAKSLIFGAGAESICVKNGRFFRQPTLRLVGWRKNIPLLAERLSPATENQQLKHRFPTSGLCGFCSNNLPALHPDLPALHPGPNVFTPLEPILRRRDPEG